MKKKNGDIKKILDKENKIYFIKRLYELINHGYMLEDSLEFLLIQYEVADDEIKKIFSQPNFSEWSMPIPQEKSIPLRWYPRNSSLKKEGIQSFVGYYQNSLVASLSIGKNSVSGSYTYNGSSFNISSKGNNIVFTKNEENEACSAEDPFHSHIENTELSVLEQGNSIPKIANTNKTIFNLIGSLLTTNHTPIPT